MEQGGIFSHNEDYNRKMRERIAQDRQEAQTQTLRQGKCHAMEEFTISLQK